MPVAGAVIGAVGSIGGGLLAAGGAKSAAKTAANAQVQSAQLGIDEQHRQYDLTRSDLMPWQKAGTGALGAQGDLLGLNGNGPQQASIDALKASPLYQSLFNNGKDTLLQTAAATGGLRGGNTQGALANFGRDTLAQVIESQLAKLGGVSTLGENAAAQVGNIGSNSANSISELLGQQGAAQAGSALAGGAANASAIKDIVGALSGFANNPAVNSLFTSNNSGLVNNVKQTIASNPSIF